MEDESFTVRSLRSMSISSEDDNNYVYVILRTSFCHIDDFDDLLEKYKKETGKEYDFNYQNKEMCKIVANSEHNRNYFRVVKVKNPFSKYIIITSYTAYDSISINFDALKIDTIKQLVSTESSDCGIIKQIEDVAFMKFKNPIIEL